MLRSAKVITRSNATSDIGKKKVIHKAARIVTKVTKASDYNLICREDLKKYHVCGGTNYQRRSSKLCLRTKKYDTLSLTPPDPTSIVDFDGTNYDKDKR